MTKLRALSGARSGPSRHDEAHLAALDAELERAVASSAKADRRRRPSARLPGENPLRKNP